MPFSPSSIPSSHINCSVCIYYLIMISMTPLFLTSPPIPHLHSLFLLPLPFPLWRFCFLLFCHTAGSLNASTWDRNCWWLNFPFLCSFHQIKLWVYHFLKKTFYSKIMNQSQKQNRVCLLGCTFVFIMGKNVNTALYSFRRVISAVGSLQNSYALCVSLWMYCMYSLTLIKGLIFSS